MTMTLPEVVTAPGLKLFKVNVEVTRTADEEFWVLAPDRKTAEGEAEDAFDPSDHHFYDTETLAYTTEAGPNKLNPQLGPVEPKEGDEILYEGKVLTWPVLLAEQLTEEERRALEIRMSIHPDQGQLL